MTQPVGSNSSLNYTPYDPEEELCKSEGTGGAGGGPSGAEGAGGAPSAPPAPYEDRGCAPELLNMVATCGSVLLSGKVVSFDTLKCLASIGNAVACLTEPQNKAQGQ